MAKQSIETALYRKYRPHTFKDVVGQDHVVKALEGAIKLGNISHAYLFAGGRGTGKTSVARIFAREIGTSERDLYEIDAASNRGIDDIRDIRDGVSVLPFDSTYKVYIIDEVHMLTKEAFNALLKTLEEPPAHAVFILATTEMEKLPETIISRCQSFAFKKPSQKVLKDIVLSIAKKEGYSLDQAGAELIALLGDGSFRDTEGILQKVISASSDKKITLEEIEAVTGAPASELVNAMVEALSSKDVSSALSAIEKASAQNIDMRIYLKLVLQKIRIALLIRYAPDMHMSFREELGEDEYAFLEKMSKNSTLNSHLLSRLLVAYTDMGRAAIKEMPFELAAIDLSS